MRHAALVVLLALLAGCEVREPDSFAYQSTLERNVRGLVLHEDGLRGHAGMMGTNCPFETVEGKVTGDYQLPDEGEKVVDSGDLIGQDTVLLVLGDDAHLLEKSTGVYAHETVTVPGLVDARLFDGGIVAITQTGDECAVVWTDTMTSVATPCGAIDADPQTGRVVLSHARGLALVDRDGLTAWSEAGAHAVLDHVTDAVYSSEGAVVRAVGLDGTALWERDLGGEVLALAEAGATGAAAAFVGFDNGTGAVVYLDGLTGEVQARVGTPGLADEITVSADGSTVAIVRQGAAHFYRLSGAWIE